MKPTSILAGAAIAGLMTGSFAVQAHASTSPSKAGTSLKQMADEGKKDVHSCKGNNSCKGKGGCKTGDNGCKGKNSCKGKGGCATAGSKPHGQNCWRGYLGEPGFIPRLFGPGESTERAGNRFQ